MGNLGLILITSAHEIYYECNQKITLDENGETTLDFIYYLYFIFQNWFGSTRDMTLH